MGFPPGKKRRGRGNGNRVLNDPLEQKELKALIIGNKLWFCGVLEAKLR